MKLTKITLTGVFVAAMMSTSCSSNSNTEGTENESAIDTLSSTNELNASSKRIENFEQLDHEMLHNESHLSSIERSPIVVREEVKLTYLPPVINETLKEEEYSNYKVERAFVLKHKDDVKTYEVNIKKDDKVSTLVFNEKGVVLDEK